MVPFSQASFIPSQQQAVAQYLAASVYDLFPHAQFCGGVGTHSLFYYDICFPFAFQKEMLSLIEERMHAIRREGKVIRHLEMIPSNALEALKYQGQLSTAKRLITDDSATVSLCQIGEWLDYCPFPFSLDPCPKFFKLLEGFDLGLPHQKITRIVGVAAKDKQGVKQLCKQPLPSSRNHLSLIQKMDLFYPLDEKGFWMWLPQAEKTRQWLEKWWRTQHLEQNFQFLSSPASLLGGRENQLLSCHLHYLKSQKIVKTAEMAYLFMGEKEERNGGLLSPSASWVDRAYIYLPLEKVLEETISSLQFILKILKILSFEFEIVLSIPKRADRKPQRFDTLEIGALFEQAMRTFDLSFSSQRVKRVEDQGGKEQVKQVARIDIELFDALGRKWSGPFLACSLIRASKKNEWVKHSCLLTRSIFGSIERWIALLIEKGQKKDRDEESLTLEDFCKMMQRCQS